MKEFLKKNFVILLAFALPIILIIVVALSAYLPSFFLKTDYNFIYSSCSDNSNYFTYNCDNYLQKIYSVSGGKLVVNYIDPTQDSDDDGVPDINEKYTVRIFLHDTEKNESREITLAEAQTLTLNDLLTSSDGVTVSSGYSNSPDFFPFFGSNSSYGHYLTKGKSRVKLNLINDSDRYHYDNFSQFIGWVLPGRN